MTNDAKLGLVVGVGLVIVVAVVFFRKDLAAERAPGPETAVASSSDHAAGAHPDSPRVSAMRTSGHKGLNHTVKSGESFYSVAQHYYGDGKKYMEIYRVNRDQVATPDYVAPGTVLFIPELASATAEAYVAQKVKVSPAVRK